MANEPKEIELKLAVTPADFGTLRAHPSFADLLAKPVSEGSLDSVYYDTDRSDLRDHGVTLRVRRENGSFVQNIKTTNGELTRSEWEQPVTGKRPDLEAAAGTPLAQVLGDHLRAAIKPVFETHVHRTLYRFTDSARGIEIAFDEGEIVAGSRSQPVCEIELELKHGDRAALFEMARAIVDAVPAQLALRSKSERGYRLAKGEGRGPPTAAEIDIPPGTGTGEAFQIITRSCLRQIIDNVPALQERDPVSLHQLRIGLRRLRTAISLFSEVVTDSRVPHIKGELKWLSRELSPARDLDALLGEVMKPLRKQHPGHRGLQSLHRSFSRQRLQEYQRASEAVQSGRFRKLLIDTFAWIEVGEWATTTDHEARLRRERPIEEHAADQLRRRRKKVRKRGREMETLDPVRRHKLRIQVKKTRYATEFFAGVFREKKSARRGQRMLTALKRLQTSLGGLNDVNTRKALCEEILAKPGRAEGPVARERAFAAGLVTGDQEARSGELMENAKKAHARVEDIKPFWK
jgi:inorganic triphosphatase YgiF